MIGVGSRSVAAAMCTLPPSPPKLVVVFYDVASNMLTGHPKQFCAYTPAVHEALHDLTVSDREGMVAAGRQIYSHGGYLALRGVYGAIVLLLSRRADLRACEKTAFKRAIKQAWDTICKWQK
jgi:hypothetical protein